MLRVGAVIVLATASAMAEPAGDATDRRRASEALVAGQLADADARYAALLAAAPIDADLWFDRCLVRYAQGDFGAAINACYRALGGGHQSRVIDLLSRIATAMGGGGIDPPNDLLPEPSEQWFTTPTLPVARPTARATRAIEEPEGGGPPQRGTFDVIAPERIASYRGTPPALPYQVAVRHEEYLRGFDVSLVIGALSYAPDAQRAVVGGRLAQFDRYPTWFVEYLQAIDSSGGIATVGMEAGLPLAPPASGSYTSKARLSPGFALSIPWGRSVGRHALIDNYTTALHGEVRMSISGEVMLTRHRSLAIAATISGGLNLGKAALAIGRAFGDICLSDDETASCPKSPDPNPGWPMYHWMARLSFTLGSRAGHRPYADYDTFHPIGGGP